MSEKPVTVSHIRSDEWVNPFGATAEELLAGALDESGLLNTETRINNQSAHSFFQSYCRKKSLFQEATRLGNILVKEAIITKEQLAEALQRQAESGKPLGEVLTSESFCRQADIEHALARQKAIRDEFYQLEQAREAKKSLWNQFVRFFSDQRPSPP